MYIMGNARENRSRMSAVRGHGRPGKDERARTCCNIDERSLTDGFDVESSGGLSSAAMLDDDAVLGIGGVFMGCDGSGSGESIGFGSFHL
jgi:hypothetical protein